MQCEVVSASTLDGNQLAGLFTAVYAGYWHPIEIDAAALERMVAIYDLALDASVVALDGDVPVGVAMLAIRDREGWVGGMGVLPDHRRQGVGARVTERLLDNARARGLSRVRLEVLVQNAPAIKIYRALGFEDVQDVVVWRLDNAPDAPPAHEVDVDDALTELAAADGETPWQRNHETIVRTRDVGADFLAVAAEGGAAAVFSLTSGHAALYGLHAPTTESALALLRAPFEHGATSLLWLNGPAQGLAAETLRAIGGVELARQHELSIAL
jgi:ribosomal protein S18 acetylase RimI-like enzyme